MVENLLKGRRLFLRLVGGTTLLLSGCACPPRRTPVTEWAQPTGLTPLAPKIIQQKSIPLAFDVHTHLFNATDVSVRGYLAGPVAHSLKPQLQKLIAAAAPLVEQIGQTLAISCGEEMDQLARKFARVKGISALSAQQELQGEIDNDVEQHLSAIEDQLFRRLPGSDFARELDNADREYQESRLRFHGAPAAATPLSRDRERIRAALRQGSEVPMRIESFTSEERALRSLDPQGVLSFIRYMVSPRHHNLRQYQKAYSEGDRAFGIDACFAALVDFDYWLRCSETSSSLRDQVLLHEQLAVLSGGFVLPLVPYNPWTDIERGGKSFELVRWAIEERGFVGVKIYPPMGFRPLGNEGPPVSQLPRPEGRKLDERLRALYRWCQNAEVPVMGHTAHSMGRDHAHDELSGPDSWEAVFREFPGLRVNGGHFGGGYHSANGVDWPREFVALMAKPGGGGLNVDLAYEEELLDPESAETARMKNLLQSRLPDGSSVLTRVMYGSDWLMISQVGDWGAYPQGINGFLSTIPSIDLAAARRVVYFENAARCFGLGKGHRNRQRLEAFYARWKVATPLWMARLDKI